MSPRIFPTPARSQQHEHDLEWRETDCRGDFRVTVSIAGKMVLQPLGQEILQKFLGRLYQYEP